MKRVLILAYYFPPFAEIGHKRPLRLANYLAAHGWRVTVYAGSRAGEGGTAHKDPALLKNIDSRIAVVRTPAFHGFQLAIRARDALRERTASSQGGNASGKAAGSGKDSGSMGVTAAAAPRPRGPVARAIDAIMGAFKIPDAYTGWIPATLPVLLFRHLAARPQAIVVTGPPWSPLVLAWLAGRILGVPVFLDYRDPWNLNPDYWARRSRLSLFLERKAVAACAGIIANTGALKTGMQERFPAAAARVHCVPNGFDADTRRSLEALRAQGVGADPERFVVSHIGTLYWQRMPEALSEAMARTAAAWQGPRDIRFRFVGLLDNPDRLREAFRKHGALDKLELAGTVDTATAKRELLRADVLLLLQPGYKFQIPAKLFEYVLSEKPLLCLLEPESEADRLIRKYALGRILAGADDTEGMRKFLRECLEGRKAAGAGTEAAVGRFFADFDGDLLSGRMARILDGEPPEP